MWQKICLALCFALVCLFSHAGVVISTENILDKLCTVNGEWKNHRDADRLQQPFTGALNQSYTGWIATHLMLVEKTLRQKDISGLSASQRENRNYLLDRLHDYREAGVFPVNDYVNYKTPVFIDRRGTHCAVGYLMQQSDADYLAHQIDAAEKLAYVHDIKTAGVTAWADKNGFTIDELAWIQPGYMPSTNFTTIGTGTNKPVNLFCPDYYHGRLAIGGDFDTLNSLPCAHIGYYKNDQLYCYGQGLQGTLYALCQYQHISANGMAAAGAFLSGDTIYPLATFTDTAWNFMAIPGRPNAKATAICQGGGSYFIGVAIQDTSMPGYEELWFNMHASGWQKKATLHGFITNAGIGSSGRCFVGAFDSLYVHRLNQADTVILAHNILFYDENYESWAGIDCDVSDTVLAFKQIGEVLYLAGTCGSGATSRVCLTRYLNGTCQAMIENISLADTINYISGMDNNGSSLLYGGSFTYIPQGIGTYCSNLASIDLTTVYGNSIGVLDAPVKSVINWNNEFFLGGDFTSASTNANLPHLAKIAPATGVPTIQKAASLQIFPNPADSKVEIKLPEEGLYSVALLNAQGAVTATYTGSQQITLDTKNLASGLYFIQVKGASGSAALEGARLVVMH